MYEGSYLLLFHLPYHSETATERAASLLNQTIDWWQQWAGSGVHPGKDSFQERLNCGFSSSVNPSFAGPPRVLLGEGMSQTTTSQRRSSSTKGRVVKRDLADTSTGMDEISMPSNTACPTACPMQHLTGATTPGDISPWHPSSPFRQGGDLINMKLLQQQPVLMFPLPYIPLCQTSSALLGGLLRAKAEAGLILVLTCCGHVSACRCVACACC